MAERARKPEPQEQDQGVRSPLAYVKALGPGLISGASDNDPTTVATLAVIGSTTVYGLSWLTILIFPMLATIQVISSRVGAVAKQGLQRAVAKEFGRIWGLVLLVSVVAVNLITIGADLEGGAAALGIMIPIDYRWFIVPFALGVLVMLFLGSYRAVQRALQYVLLVFLAYIVSAFLAHPDWGTVLHQTILPPISLNAIYVQGALALLGTTLTSYAYVWESIEIAEERPPIPQLGLQQADAGFGMFFAVSIFWFIEISTAATLGIHHKHAQTAQQAAQALQPVAGPVAGYLFALGLLASSILAVPVLAATTAYMVGHEFGWRSGLSEGIRKAWRFYAVVAATIVIAIVVSFLGISPIQLLFVSGIVGGLATPISMVFLLIIARNHHVMDDLRMGPFLTVGGWATAAVVTLASLTFLWQQFGGTL